MSQEDPSIEQNSIFHEYIQMRKQYCKDMEKMLHSGEYKKASELVWGTITQSMKTLATVSGIPMPNHDFSSNQIHHIFEKITDEEYHQLFLYLNKLHWNFIDKEIETLEFPLHLEKATTFLERTDFLIKITKDNL
jgi:hypothetical protein